MTKPSLEPSLEPLDQELERLLHAERVGPGMPADARGRVMERLGATLGLAPVAGGASGTQGGGTGAAGSGVGAALAGRVATGLVGLAIGAVLGFAGYAGLAVEPTPLGPAMPRMVVVVAWPAASEAPRIEEHAAAPSESEALGERANEATAPPARSALDGRGADSAPPGRDVDLAAERALLEVARTALARRDAEAALAALGRHSQRYAQGRLVEERESLTIQALAASGRMDEAQRRAERFRERSPNSMLLPAVDAVLEEPHKSDPRVNRR